MAVKDGGPAFPVECDWFRTGDDVELRGVQTGNNSGWHQGMTLRDYLAGQFLVGAGMALAGDATPLSGDEARFLAQKALCIADAMLMERDRP